MTLKSWKLNLSFLPQKRTHRLISVILCLIFFLLESCSSHRPSSPMRDKPIFSSQKLHIAILGFGLSLDRGQFNRCAQDFPALTVYSEPDTVAILREQRIYPEKLLEWGEDFSLYQRLQGIELFLLTFEENGVSYLRTVNYLSRSISTVVLDIASPSCIQLLKSQRLLLVQSHPPLADVAINGRNLGEAPIWTQLKDGRYQVSCKLPGEVFRPVSVLIPEDVQVLCQRENTSGDRQSKEIGTDEAVGSVFIFVVGALVSLAAAVLPFLFFF